MNVTGNDARGSGFFFFVDRILLFKFSKRLEALIFSLKNSLICSEVLVSFQKENKGKPIDSNRKV